ncbi:DUF63 family protein [Halosolutus halophilus]|uniref:DUF63 family protein n=1 Tax=Halosolutus halophilus TaxID=1552990 RepID=UPI00223522B7|nr:DUF63 family protein [Halosolutus halophilus]
MVLPEGFALPPWYFLVPLLVVLTGVVVLLWTVDPPVTDRTVLAFAPWMMFGSALHVLYQIGVYPDGIAVLFTTPSVYLVTATLAGGIWLLGVFLYAAGLQSSVSQFVGITGTAFFVAFATFAIVSRSGEGALDPFWPVIGVVVAGLVTAIAWLALSLWFTEVAAVTSITGVLVVFSHTLDGVSTAIGYDVLGVSENVPLSLLILEVGSNLPTAEYIGSGWLFVLVKVALALLILGLFKEYVQEAPRQARTILGLVAAVGLGPGVHNVLLFTLG